MDLQEGLDADKSVSAAFATLLALSSCSTGIPAIRSTTVFMHRDSEDTIIRLAKQRSLQWLSPWDEALIFLGLFQLDPEFEWIHFNGQSSLHVG